MRRTVLIVVLLAVAVGGGWWFSHRNARAKTDTSGTDPIPVLVATAEARDVPIWLEGLGTVQASATVTVKAQVDGMLSEVRFREGQDVHTGDILAKIDPRTYQAALDQATAKKAQDAANLANARVDLTRYTKLAATAYTSAQQADTQRSTVAQLEAQVAQDQAQIDSARAQLSYTTITSPIDGRTGIRQVDQGNLVHAADTTGIVVITTLRPIAVVFTLPQQALPDVVAAQAHGAPVVEALPQGAAGAQPLDVGTLAVLDNQVDPTTGTIKLKATFPNAQRRLWPGGFVGVRLRSRVATGAIVVPPAAIQRGPQGAYVFVVGAGDSVKRQAVTVGYEDQQTTVVTDGLSSGAMVVTDGASRLSDGMKVVVAKPEASDPGGTDQATAPGTRQRRSGGG
jgi:multidrug efflux system membrane fusion protein